jgi:hypothetical protein
LFLPLPYPGVNFINARLAPVFFDLCDRIAFPAFEQDDESEEAGKGRQGAGSLLG